MNGGRLVEEQWSCNCSKQRKVNTGFVHGGLNAERKMEDGRWKMKVKVKVNEWKSDSDSDSDNTSTTPVQ